MGVDARDVLAKYIALVNTRQRLICNESELPYPKQIIQIVLKDELKRAGDDVFARNRIRSLYLALAKFPLMTPDEQMAVAEIDGAPAGDWPFPDSKARGEIARKQALHALVMERVTWDAEELMQELEHL